MALVVTRLSGHERPNVLVLARQNQPRQPETKIPEPAIHFWPVACLMRFPIVSNSLSMGLLLSAAF